jgi:hypothetical protein
MTDDDFSNFSFELQKVADETSMLAVTRLLATTLTKNPYMRVQDFFVSLSDYDLNILNEIASNIKEEEDGEPVEEYGDPHAAEILLIAEMLARAEGVHSQNIEQSTSIMNSFMGFLAVQGLYRKKLVKIYRENFSFGEEMADKVICGRLEGVDYDNLRKL